MSNLIIPAGNAVIENEHGKTVVTHQNLSMDEAKLLREFKRKILQKYGLAYEMHCRECMVSGKEHETQGGVTDDRIAIACAHRMLTYIGQTF